MKTPAAPTHLPPARPGLPAPRQDPYRLRRQPLAAGRSDGEPNMTNTPDPVPPIVRSAAGIAPANRTATPQDALPQAAEVLAVCAHPDDESFGLGAVLAAFSEQGTRVRVLCLTHGEASTLGVTQRSLGQVRTEELRAAADVLGVEHVELFAYPDGQLQQVPIEELAGLVDRSIAAADVLLVFDHGGITGHPDHCRATDAAIAAGTPRHLPVLAWALPEHVATELNTEFGASFVGRARHDLDVTIEVDRGRQHAAISCHATQSTDNPVLRRRLELLGGHEHLRWLNRPAPSPTWTADITLAAYSEAVHLISPRRQ